MGGLQRIKIKQTEADILKLLLEDKRSPNTRRAYEKDLRDFFRFAAEAEPTPELVNEFLGLDRADAVMLVLQYKAHLINKGLAEATVNRRLAAIKALCKYGRKLGRCDYSLEDVQAEKVQGYRDTSGVEAQTYRKILDGCDRPTIKGIRDYAILRLFWDNALRRGELVKLNVEDFDPLEKRIRIFGKGKGKQFVFMDLSDRTIEAIQEWLNTKGELNPSDPLFTSLMPGRKTQRITGDGLWRIVRDYAQKAGITRNFSPHRIRHSSITTALNETDGDVRSTMSLSRNTAPVLMRYDDNRKQTQKRITNILSDLV